MKKIMKNSHQILQTLSFCGTISRVIDILDIVNKNEKTSKENHKNGI